MKTNDAARIFLYGDQTRIGWQATYDSPMTKKTECLGDKVLSVDATPSEAIWQAAESLRRAGVTSGPVAIYDISGRYVARVLIQHPVPMYGALPWQLDGAAQVLSDNDVRAKT